MTMCSAEKNHFLGSYHFLPGEGGSLFVIVNRQFFLVPPLACGQKFRSYFISNNDIGTILQNLVCQQKNKQFQFPMHYLCKQFHILPIAQDLLMDSYFVGTIFWQCCKKNYLLHLSIFPCLGVSLDDPGISDEKEPLQIRVIMWNIVDFSNGLKNLESLTVVN